MQRGGLNKETKMYCSCKALKSKETGALDSYFMVTRVKKGINKKYETKQWWLRLDKIEKEFK